MTWTVHNDYGKPVNLTNIKILPTGETHADIALQANGTDTFTTTYKGDAKNDLVLSVDGLWQDGPGKVWPSNGHPANFKSNPVKLPGNCAPKTTPSPSKSPSKSPSPTPEASRSVPPATPSASPTPGLPVTGSNTTLPMVGTGAALVAGGAALVFTLRRRRRVQFTAE
ncbi:LPXTG cell wall anchor domain-containing protein [Dactylosporangium sp. CS-033363]|uniref:LPXTG cell wall anchor domain-containing protein n=1 Tax=Dactylosporangium sp. CS-033363 TaxID=3239935 RepID=UPI003D919B21